MDYSKLTVSEFLDQTRSGSLDLRDFYPRLFKRLKELNRTYNIFVTIPPEPDTQTLRNTPKGTLTGLPFSLKDNICSKGVQSTAGSKILKGYIPPFDATAASRIKEQGGHLCGKTNQDEFGFGWASTNSGYQIPKNPIDPTRVSGGSSGGAAVLTKALEYPHIALGQSTGGSITSPASFCGVVGLTPTYGLVSRYGLIDYGNSLDKIGSIARTVEDIALMLSVISGHDPRDSTSIPKKPKNYRKSLRSNLKGLKVGVPKECFGKGIGRGVEKTVKDSISQLEKSGAKVKEVSLPMTRDAISIYYIIATSEASTNLAKYCGLRYGAEEEVEGHFNDYFSRVRSKNFGEEAKRRILLGTFSRMAGFRDAYYLKAMKARTLLINEYKKVFKSCDVLATPSMPFIAPTFLEAKQMSPLEEYMADILTVSPNLAGIPHISVPCGESKGMPVGLQFMANHLDEQTLLNAAYGLQKEVSK